jgi:prepilin-type N-terminal cleavage/methylation domain-containing protein/prepilin-type processing-associated H-X9-DG protein
MTLQLPLSSFIELWRSEHLPLLTIGQRIMKNPRRIFCAFTLIELLAVLTVLSLCAASFLPALARTKTPAQRIYCANNLKGIGEAFQVWGQDHGDAFPMRVTAANGGYNDFIGLRVISTTQTNPRGVFGIFRCLSNELSTPNVLFCPAENEIRLPGRMPATTFASVVPPDSTGAVPLTNDLNVSYFVGVDAAQTNPRGFLAGDHNLGSDGNVLPIKGFVTAPSSYSPDFKVSLGTNFIANGGVGWLNTMHSNQGNVGLADGSVSLFNRVQLQNALRNSGVSPSIGFGPNFPSPIGCSGLGLNRIQFP